MSDRVRTAWREHDTSGYDCWCGPRYEGVCPECGGAGCWRCAGGEGMIPLIRGEVEWFDGGTLTIHNDPNDLAPELPLPVPAR